MPNDTQYKIRVVAEWAGMWKPGQMCPRGFHQCYHGTNGALLISEHEIPPPGLLAPAGAWALLMSLKNSPRISPFEKHAIASSLMHPLVETPMELLLDAAYQLATKEQR